MLTLGLTGGIGSGKSTVSRLLAARGARIVNLDDVAREVLESEEISAVIEGAWPQVVHGGVIDRAALAGIVFEDAEELARLNALTHPAAWAAADAEVAQAAREEPDGIVVVESAILAGSPRQDSYHANILVEADTETRVARLVETRGLAEEDARARIASQRDAETLRAIADVALDNSGDEEALEAAVEQLWEEWIVPYAVNAFSGQRLLGSDAPADAMALGRLVARLRSRGIDALARDGAITLIGPDASELDLASAGCVRRVEAHADARTAPAGYIAGDVGYVAGDPRFLLEVRS